MSFSSVSIHQYHVFLASPGDVNNERQTVRQFFERYNRHTAQLWGVRFEEVRTLSGGHIMGMQDSTLESPQSRRPSQITD